MKAVRLRILHTHVRLDRPRVGVTGCEVLVPLDRSSVRVSRIYGVDVAPIRRWELAQWPERHGTGRRAMLVYGTRSNARGRRGGIRTDRLPAACDSGTKRYHADIRGPIPVGRSGGLHRQQLTRTWGKLS